MLACKLIIALCTAGAFLYVLLNAYPEKDVWFRGIILFELLYAALFGILAGTYKSFRIGILRYKELLFTYILSTFIVNLIMYFALSLSAKQLLSVGPMLEMTLVQWISGAILYKLSDVIYFRLHPARNSLIILSSDRHEYSFIEKLKSIRERYSIAKVITEDLGEEQILEELEAYSTVFTGEIDYHLRLKITDYCFDHNKRLLIMPTLGDITYNNATETFVGDSLMYLCRNRAFSIEQLAIKRISDILLSLIGIILTSPVMLISAIIIKCQDGGPVFYRQTRYTRNFAKFELIKFRSMIVDAEKNGAQFTTENDDRITPYGRFIRKHRIDELPQLFNIIRGEMSIVGPRAERVENVEYYCRMMPEFKYRMKVKAGLTGYAQIYGRYNTTYADKLKLDLLYIQNCSLFRDLQLMFQTVTVLFTPESTEGFTVKTLYELEQQEERKDDETN